jgi:hypothetical protein
MYGTCDHLLATRAAAAAHTRFAHFEVSYTDLLFADGERERGKGRARSLRSGAACAASAAGLTMRLQQPWLRATFAFAVCAVVATCVVRALQGSHHTPLGQCSTRSVHSLAMVQRHEEQPKQRQSEQQGLSRRSALGKFAQGVTVAAATAGMPSKTSALFEDYRKEGGCPTYEMVKGASVQNFEIEKVSVHALDNSVKRLFERFMQHSKVAAKAESLTAQQ